jgi:hypothetical protein
MKMGCQQKKSDYDHGSLLTPLFVQLAGIGILLGCQVKGHCGLVCCILYMSSADEGNAPFDNCVHVLLIMEGKSCIIVSANSTGADKTTDQPCLQLLLVTGDSICL